MLKIKLNKHSVLYVRNGVLYVRNGVLHVCNGVLHVLNVSSIHQCLYASNKRLKMFEMWERRGETQILHLNDKLVLLFVNIDLYVSHPRATCATLSLRPNHGLQV